MNVNNKEKWGFLRETEKEAQEAGVDTDTGLHRTGLEKYLEIIFPGEEWIHNKTIRDSNSKTISKRRPDYRCERKKLIIEFDGEPHYRNPRIIKEDIKRNEEYEALHYTVIRIPFFIQLTNQVVKQLFHIEVKEKLFNEKYPSLGINGLTPAKLCGAGVVRMAKEFHKFPEQYEVNLKALKKADDEILTGAELLEMVYNSIKK